MKKVTMIILVIAGILMIYGMMNLNTSNERKYQTIEDMMPLISIFLSVGLVCTLTISWMFRLSRK